MVEVPIAARRRCGLAAIMVVADAALAAEQSLLAFLRAATRRRLTSMVAKSASLLLRESYRYPRRCRLPYSAPSPPSPCPYTPMPGEPSRSVPDDRPSTPIKPSLTYAVIGHEKIDQHSTCTISTVWQVSWEDREGGGGSDEVIRSGRRSDTNPVTSLGYSIHGSSAGPCWCAIGAPARRLPR
jgi:hypothetical protein